jgi:hypothetical protein
MSGDAANHRRRACGDAANDPTTNVSDRVLRVNVLHQIAASGSNPNRLGVWRPRLACCEPVRLTRRLLKHSQKSVSLERMGFVRHRG